MKRTRRGRIGWCFKEVDILATGEHHARFCWTAERAFQMGTRTMAGALLLGGWWCFIASSSRVSIGTAIRTATARIADANWVIPACSVLTIGGTVSVVAKPVVVDTIGTSALLRFGLDTALIGWQWLKRSRFSVVAIGAIKIGKVKGVAPILLGREENDHAVDVSDGRIGSIGKGELETFPTTVAARDESIVTAVATDWIVVWPSLGAVFELQNDLGTRCRRCGMDVDEELVRSSEV